MLNALGLFGITFVLVFALGFQTLNISSGNYLASFLTSFVLGIANLVVLRTVPQGSVIEIAAYLCGGPFGVIASMWIHSRFFNNKRKGSEGMEQCNAIDCLVRIEKNAFMCEEHLRMLVKDKQEKVWEAYRKRGLPGRNPAGWADYYEACAEAVELVAANEGKTVVNSFRCMAAKFRTFAEERASQSTAVQG